MPFTPTTEGVVPYEAMLPSGVAWLGEDRWSITAELGDLSFLIAPEEMQNAILTRWAGWLNSIGGGITLQLTVTNSLIPEGSFARASLMPLSGDEKDDDLRDEFNAHVSGKLLMSRGNVLTRRYATFTLTGESDPGAATTRLQRVLAEAQTELRGLTENGGASLRMLGRADRLELLASLTRRRAPFGFSEDEVRYGGTTLEAVAPDRVLPRNDHLVITADGSETYRATVWVSRLPAYLSTKLISAVTAIRADLSVSVHLHPYDTAEGLEMVNAQIANIDMQWATEVKKLAKQGLPADMVPHSLQVARAEAQELRRALETTNQHLWSTLITVGIAADSKVELNRLIEQVTTALRAKSCTGLLARKMMPDGWRTDLPTGFKALPMTRTLTTSVIAVMHPFTTQELLHTGGIWYGANAGSGNPILVSRWEAMNGNGFFLGTSGSGKSAAVKYEMACVLLRPDDDDVIIIDPEREYRRMVDRFNGQLIVVDGTTKRTINAFDMSVETSSGDPVIEKSQFILGLTSALIGGTSGLDAVQRSLIDAATREVLHAWLDSPQDTEPPTLRDLRDTLDRTENPDAIALARALDLYVDGSLGAFSEQTNVRLDNQLICYDLADMSAQLKPMAMMVILDQIWNRIQSNHAKGKRTWVYIDEFHLFFRFPELAEHFLTYFKRGRKYGALLSGVTQNIDELLAIESARLMLANSDFLLLLNQNSTDALALANVMGLSSEQSRYFSGVPAGHGLLKSGSSWVPFDNEMEDTPLRTWLGTKPGATTQNHPAADPQPERTGATRV